MPCDYKRYPDNWKQIRAAILDRAVDRCENCGAPNHSIGERHPDGAFLVYEGMELEAAVLDEVKLTRIVLTIAHLDHDIGHNSPENLRALCQMCHNKHDIEHRKETRAATLRSLRTAPLFDGKDTAAPTGVKRFS